MYAGGMTTSEGRVVHSVDYTPSSLTTPAFLVLTVEDDSPLGVRTVTLQGKAAKKLSNLREGDKYYDTAE